ncbi:MAG: Ig domain-containing protein [Gemmatimonadales bacterium]|nr:Ig domain-containing protein [Gemmatimonadales bacterium]
MRKVSLSSLVLLLAACGGGGDSGTNAPPPPPPGPVPVASVAVTLSANSIFLGGGATATAVARDAANNTLTGRSVTWTSSDPTVAVVLGSGAINTIAIGTTNITATIDGVAGSASFTVAPMPVATVNVTLTTATLAPGQGTLATASLLSSTGAALTGRVVTWLSTNPAVATVAGSGAVTAVSPGTTQITASSEGRSGFATLTVTQPPVATVTISGTERVKAGDAYQYTATARLGDGTVVVRPVTWSVVESGRGTITQGGVLTPAGVGALTVRATVEGVTFNGAVTSYDWTLVTGGVVSAYLPADFSIVNRLGQSEYPKLWVGCSLTSGFFGLYVDMDNFITQSGGVSYSFDGGTIFSTTWLEFDNFSAIGHPGPSNLATKNFASLIGLSRQFGFAFTEFLGTAKATIFRVTGLTPYLNQVLAACPSNNLRDGESRLMEQMQVFDHPTPMNVERMERQRQGAVTSIAPVLVVPPAAQPVQLKPRTP